MTFMKQTNPRRYEEFFVASLNQSVKNINQLDVIIDASKIVFLSKPNNQSVSFNLINHSISYAINPTINKSVTQSPNQSASQSINQLFIVAESDEKRKPLELLRKPRNWQKKWLAGKKNSNFASSSTEPWRWNRVVWSIRSRSLARSSFLTTSSSSGWGSTYRTLKDGRNK